MADGHREPERRWLAAAMCVALAGAVEGAPPRPGQVTCATCHRAEAQSQPKTAMGIGIELPPNQEPLQAHPKLTLEANGYRYGIRWLPASAWGAPAAVPGWGAVRCRSPWRFSAAIAPRRGGR